MNTTNTEDLVNEIISTWEAGIDEDAIVIAKIVSQFGIPKDDAELALELTRTGLFRASVMSKGDEYPLHKPGDNAIIDAALKIGLAKLAPQAPGIDANKQRKPWWKFW